MKSKYLALLVSAAFALGSGLSASAVQPARIGCLACHNNCDAIFEACLDNGPLTPTECAVRSRVCHAACGCPIP